MIPTTLPSHISPSKSSMSESKPTVKHGRLRIQLINCYLNVPVKRPYVIVTMGDQIHQSSISEYSQGNWNECFEFYVSFHAQIFDTIQLDLYDSYMLLPDRHIGRAEIRLRQLEGMPETFTSYYEIWDKRLSTGATSSVSRKKTMAANMGALEATISYVYQSNGGSEVDHSHNISRYSPTVDQLAAENFQRQLVNQRAQETDVKFRKYEERGKKPTLAEEDGYPDDSDSDNERRRRPISYSVRRASRTELVQSEPRTPPASTPASTTVFSTVTSWLGLSSQSSASTDHTREMQQMTEEHAPSPDLLQEENESLKTYPILDAIGSWTVTKETNQVLRAIGKLLAAFGQGFELSHMQILTGFSVVEKFYNDIPRDRTWDTVESLSEIDLASHFWRFSVATYGWKGVNFLGHGNGYISDAVRNQSDTLSVREYLSLPKEDMLAYEFRSTEAFRPSYFIARDRSTNSIVLCIRGTMSIFDTMTDLVCEYEPWKGGYVHKGMKSSALWFFQHIAPKLVAYTNKHSTSALYIVGHSLGAATAAILTILLLDYMDEFQQGKEEPFTLQCFGYAPACGLSLDLAEKYQDHIQSIVFADDFVSKLSYGSMMDIKELILAGAEAAKHLSLSQLFFTGEPTGPEWKTAFDRVAEARKRCLDSMSNPRFSS
ncbi:uncharacterized protein BYT42DRAFT_49753 [Radiomyces spectabilis]|uniref:uncharacterized protein n=1 Tax=Radiomyces spectabilis TaxID=64574 RepID=UPI00221EA924|nr:uncharacterized protein BYT42DRAFT_49753 [Radiomyces spectabilis]KAI8372887.1 hypothetical protein BYT42DRAFT_49753 [Radiomyces spectabilis]